MSEHVPQWLIAAGDQRLAELTAGGAKLLAAIMGTDTVMSPLCEPPEGTSREEFERLEYVCDNCGKDCNDDRMNFWSGAYTPGRKITGKLTVIFGWGACRECRFLP